MLCDADVRYIRGNFVPLSELAGARGMELDEVTALIDRRCLPRPSYVLDDGTEMVPPDYFALYDAAGREGVERLFRQRLAVQAQQLGLTWSESEFSEKWEGYLSGDYGVCLREVTPENICAKGLHVDAIEQLLEQRRPALPQRFRRSACGFSLTSSGGRVGLWQRNHWPKRCLDAARKS